MERLLAIWIKELSAEAPDGSTLRTTLSLIDALQIICPFTEAIRLGLFAVSYTHLTLPTNREV